MIKSMAVAELVEDMDVYPRHAVDDAHVASLVRALEAGETLPPVVAEKKSKRIVDGWHRVRAYRRFKGPEYVADVELKTYPDEAALLIDAVTLNATHGRKLDAIDQTRAVIMLQRVNVSPATIAMALHVPEAHVIKLRVKVATATHEGTGTVPGTNQVTLKRPVAWMAGQKLTDDQVKAHGTLPGTSFLLIAKQLTTALKNRMCDLSDEKLVEGLKALSAELKKALDKAAA